MPAKARGWARLLQLAPLPGGRPSPRRPPAAAVGPALLAAGRAMWTAVRSCRGLPIVIAPDERLTARASEVTDINGAIEELVTDMFETLCDTDGIGLAAVQVGVLKRICVVDIQPEGTEDGQDMKKQNKAEEAEYESIGKFCMINPEITELSDVQVELTEGCLSLPEQKYKIKRPKYLTVKYIDLHSEEQTLKASGWLARCIQHEIDHLNGILYIRHLSKLKYYLATKKAQKVKRHYEDEEVELLKHYHEVAVGCTLRESEEEKRAANKIKQQTQHPRGLIASGARRVYSQLCTSQLWKAMKS